jgi:hypothetical protein
MAPRGRLNVNRCLLAGCACTANTPLKAAWAVGGNRRQPLTGRLFRKVHLWEQDDRNRQVHHSRAGSQSARHGLLERPQRGKEHRLILRGPTTSSRLTGVEFAWSRFYQERPELIASSPMVGVAATDSHAIGSCCGSKPSPPIERGPARTPAPVSHTAIWFYEQHALPARGGSHLPSDYQIDAPSPPRALWGEGAAH